MGAFDTVRGEARCPSCGDRHFVSYQTKVFDPDFGGEHSRELSVGRSHRLEQDADELLRTRVHDEWWRVREPRGGSELSILASPASLFACTCGLPLAVVARFAVGRDGSSSHVRLVALDLLDARSATVPQEIDLADGEHLFRGDHAAFRAALDHLASLPEAERAEHLHAELVARFDGLDAPIDPSWTELTGPVTCEACGAQRARRLLFSTHAVRFLLGDGWAGGELRIGARITGDPSWIDEDVDRGTYLRVCAPAPAARAVVVHEGPLDWGCACGAGWAAAVVRWAREPDALVLESVTLRAHTDDGTGALDGIDYVYAPGNVRTPRTEGEPPRWVPRDRDEAISSLLAAWRQR